MKAIFVNDHIFYHVPETDRYYSGGSFPAYVWGRYLEHFEELTVFSRGKPLRNGGTGYADTNNPKVQFDLLYDVGGGKDYLIKRREIAKKFATLLADVEAVIIRLPSSIGLICAEVCQNRRIPYATEVVGCVWDATWNYGPIVPKFLAPVLYRKTKVAVSSSIGSIYVTESFLQQRYPNNDGIKAYASNVEIEDFSKELLKDRDKPSAKQQNVFKLGMIANLEVRYKGFDVAFKALGAVKKKGQQVELCLAGGGAPDYVRSLADKYNLEEELSVLGRLESGRQIYDFLDGLDLYIHPSRQEGLPRSVIEAMSRGCPVLASSVAGIPEL
ncbi:MAG: glycosyltransferase, partial [Bacteroidota bacterium]